MFVHERALVETDDVGAGTRVWAFAHAVRGARIGADCSVCDHTFVEDNVIFGDRVTIKSGVYLWDGVRLEDDVFGTASASRTTCSLGLRRRSRMIRFRGASVRSSA